MSGLGDFCFLLLLKVFRPAYFNIIIVKLKLIVINRALFFLQEDFDSFRPLCYPSTDVFIVCFSVVSPTSFSNVSTKWIPEIREFNPKAPIILVGTHSDLKNCMKVLLELSEKDECPISLKRAQRLVKKARCVCYVETSSVTQKNLKTAFDEAISSGILPPKSSKTIDLRGCVCGVM